MSIRNYAKKIGLVLINIALLYWLFTQLLASPTYTEDDLHRERQHAVELARGGEIQDALIRLHSLSEFAEDHQPLWQDYAIVLTWDGQDTEALAQLEHIDLATAPDYFIDDMLAASARMGASATALELAREGARRQPPLKAAIQRTQQQFEQAGDAQTARQLDQYLAASTPHNAQTESTKTHASHSTDEPTSAQTDRSAKQPMRLTQSELEHSAWQARSQGHYAKALKLYKEGAKRFPENRQFALGAALCLIEMRRPLEAQSQLDALQKRFPKARDVKAARVYAARHNQQWSKALALQSELLNKSPNPQSDSMNWLVLAEQRHADNAAAMRQEIANQLRQNPNNRWLREALLVRLTWAQKHQQANHHARRLNPRTMSERALEAAAFSARSSEQNQRAATLYSVGRQRFPNNHTFTRGLALAQAADGQKYEAIHTLREMETTSTMTPDQRIALADTYADQGAYLKAQEHYHTVYKNDPSNTAAYESWLINLSKAGLAEVAYRDFQQSDIDISETARAELMARHTAHTIRRSRSEDYSPKQRLAIAKTALQLSEETIAYLRTALPSEEARWFHAEGDRLRALANLEREADVTRAYEQMRAQFDKTPANDIQLMAASAYLRQQQPERAEALAHEVLAKNSGDYQALETLYFAELAQEKHSAASNTLKQLVDGQAIWRWSEDGRIHRPNPRRLTAERTRAMHQAYMNNLAEAERQFDAMLARAPSNTDIKTDRATLYRWRGWPRRSQRAIDPILVNEPMLYSARQGRFYNAMATQDYQQAEHEVAALNRDFPEKADTKTVNAIWRIHQLDSLNIEAGWSRGTGSSFESDDWQLEATYFTSPWQHHKHYRSFVRGRLALSDFGSSDSIERLGAGIEYRGYWGSWQAELSQSLSSNDVGFSLSGLLQITDQWQATGGYQSYSDQTPVRAAAADISLATLDLGLNYTPNERHGYRMNTSLGDFSDDNQRLQLGLSGYQHFYQDPIHQWTLHEYASQQSNDPLAAPYYNPEQATTVGLGLEYIGVIHQRYYRHFKQRLRLDLSRTAEKNFSAGAGWNFTYEHLWQRSRTFNWHYGIGIGSARYDGDSEDVLRLFGGLTWRF
ncbi:tetratricopeptide repeat domain protein [gamma proteobacterium HTCC5015]|nr:tetratricopeptide repeat domain protein [gamma proteobacterium HTCC5015]